MSKEIELDDGDRILISRTDRLGDLVLALPFIETVKNRYPDCRVDVIASLYASPILENNDNVDKILRVQNDQLHSNNLYRKDLLQKVRKEKYKVVVVLYPERQISKLFYDAQIPVRVGTAGRFHSVFFNTHLMHSRKKNVKHEFKYNLDFLKFFRPGPVVDNPRVYLREKELRNARRILKKAGVDGSFVVMHPGSGGSAENWPILYFMKLYRELEQKGIQLVISGSDAEGAETDSVAGQLGLQVRKITGETDLRTLAAVLSLADVVVANSTGPLHLAVAVGTKVVGLYPSKKAMSPIRWGPLGKYDLVLQPETTVCQCPSRECKCMEEIKPEQVAQAVLGLIGRVQKARSK